MSATLDSMRAILGYNDPVVFAYVGWMFVVSYYLVTLGFLTYGGATSGFWKRNGCFDVITSIIWSGFTVMLIISSIDLLIKNQLPLLFLAKYYVLFLFLFAFIYSVLEWHSSGSVENRHRDSWSGEIQSLIMSVTMMTGSGHSTATPKGLRAESVAAIQSLLGLVFVAVFIAKAVSAVSADPPLE
jgi:hypothetical protein